jgi:hypothetical protein
MKLLALALMPVLMSGVVFAAQKNSPVKTDLNKKNVDGSYADNLQSGKLFFQVSEGGKLYNDYEILEFTANGNNKSAFLMRVSLSSIEKNSFHGDLFYPNVFEYGSDSGNLTNVRVNKYTVAFDIDLGFLEKDGAKRILHFEAKRNCEKCNQYTATVSGLYKSLVDGKAVNVDWKQVASIKLTYPISDF